MPARLRSALAASLAASLAAQGVHTSDAACPSERPGASDDENLGLCLADARKARSSGDVPSAASAYEGALQYARRAYEAGRAGAAASWFADTGDQLIHYGTEGCNLARALEPSRARSVLDTCVEFLDTYLADLDARQAADSRAAVAARKRRDELVALREPLLTPPPQPPPAEPPAPPPPSVPAPDASAPVPDASTLVDAAPPSPPSDGGAGAPMRPPPPRARLDIGLGVASSLGALSVAGLVAGGVLGGDAARSVEQSDIADAVAPGEPICGNFMAPAACDDLRTARGLYVAGAVGLGLSLAAVTVLGALQIRQRRSRPHAAAPAVSASGRTPTIGLSLGF